MELGLIIFPADYTIAPARLARLAEERGFESLFFPEHTHIPVSRRRPGPEAAISRRSTATRTTPSSGWRWPRP